MSAASRLLYAQFFVVFPLAVVTWVAIAESLYWRIWWLDSPMHFAGGVWTGLCAAWIMARRGETFSLAWCLAFALVIGVGWEVFEYSEGIASLQSVRRMSYPVDTAKDIILDLFGAFVGWNIARSITTRKSTS